MFRFGGWISLSNIISVIQENAERLLIAGLMPISVVLYYSIPKDMLDRIYILPSSLCKTLFPIVSTIDKTKKTEIKKLFFSSLKFISFTIGIVLVIIVIFSKVFLSLWINNEFSVLATPVIYCLSFGVLASSLNLIPFTFFQALGMPEVTAKQQLIRFPIILLVAFLLIGKYGLLGAAISWSFGRILALFMNLWYIYIKIELKVKDILNLNIFMLLLNFPLFFYINSIFNKNKSFLELIFICFSILIVYFLYNWIFVFSCKDKLYIKDLLRIK